MSDLRFRAILATPAASRHKTVFAKSRHDLVDRIAAAVQASLWPHKTPWVAFEIDAPASARTPVASGVTP